MIPILCTILYVIGVVVCFTLFIKNEKNNGCYIDAEDVVFSGFMSIIWPITICIYLFIKFIDFVVDVVND